MDFSSSLQNKAAELLNKAKILQEISIQWESPIKIKCGELNQVENKFTIETPLEAKKKTPAIYYFEILNNEKTGIIVNALLNFKNGNIKRACPQIEKNRSKSTVFLYCGSVRQNLQMRYKQHLGYGHEKTYALHLCYWARELNLELNYNYAWLDDKYVDYLEVIESALANHLTPLVGKIAH